jgi:geranylgeranyl diphosphate synthase type II
MSLLVRRVKEENQDTMDLAKYLKEKRAIVEDRLETYFPEPEGPASDIVASMRYSLVAGGKRLRPILCIAAAEAVGGAESEVLDVACALELIHTYSLIHDDLPVMDDDDLRRGKPTNHTVFGEAIALLAGDGLLTEAFHLMAGARLKEKVSARKLLEVIGMIARAAGYQGMVGGQVVDIQSEGKDVEFSTLEFMHAHKTGALICASVKSGVILGGGNGSQIEAMTSYGNCIGKAFQISDDNLDIESDTETLGKTVGADRQKGKTTYPSLIGLSRSKEIQAQLIETAILSLEAFDRGADPLREIARYIIERKK